MPLRPGQRAVVQSTVRFRVLIAGRRFGKTYLSIRELAKAAASVNRKVWYIAPTYRQAKQIAWVKLKEMLIRHNWLERANESELTAYLRGNGSTISLRGADNPDSLRGVGLHRVVLDEFADIDSAAWTEVLRPALSDTGGDALFIGTPKGKNWAYELFCRGESPDHPDWASWQYTTLDGGNVPPEEIEAARNDLDERTFRQEYEATFENFAGIIYHAFDRTRNVDVNIDVDENAPLLWSHDFNIGQGKPMSSLIAQIRRENGVRVLHVLDEIVIESADTNDIIGEMKTRPWLERAGKAIIYGDAAGRARDTRSKETDFSLLANAGFRDQKVPPSNPPIRERHNTVNGLLYAASGAVRLKIHPRCKTLVKGLETTVLRAGSSYLEDDSTREQHVTTALGYLCCEEFPMRRL